MKMTIDYGTTSKNEKQNTWAWLLFGLITPLIICAVRAVPLIIDPGIPFDTQYTYLPIARMVLENFPSLWKSEIMLKTGPGAYFYMALMQADMAIIKASNLAISLITLILLFDATWKLAGHIASIACAWLYCLSPTFFILTVYPLGEPPFILFSAIWIWCCITIDQNRSKKANIFLIILGGISLSIATLTRGTYLYLIPTIIIASIILSYKFPNTKFWKKIIYLHLLALLIIGAYIVKNGIYFNQFSIANGTGNALYYGNNSMFYGQEPPFFGVSYDDFYGRGEAEHLSIDAEKKQMEIVRNMISDKTLFENAKLYFYKSGIVLFFSSTHLKNYTDRAWRILLIFFSIIAIGLNYKSKLITGLAIITLYQWSVHIPVLYNPRYSIAALDITLTLLAAAGIYSAFFRLKSIKSKTTLISALLICIVGGALHQRHSGKLILDIESMYIKEKTVIDSESIKFKGLDKSPINQIAHSIDGKFSIEFNVNDINLNELSVLNLGNIVFDKSCRSLFFSRKYPSGTEKNNSISLKTLQSGQNFSWGLTDINQAEMGGDIKLDFVCKKNINIMIPKIEIFNGGNGYQYRDKKLF